MREFGPISFWISVLEKTGTCVANQAKGAALVRLLVPQADMAELVYATDLKSVPRKRMGVQVPLSAPPCALAGFGTGHPEVV